MKLVPNGLDKAYPKFGGISPHIIKLMRILIKINCDKKHMIFFDLGKLYIGYYYNYFFINMYYYDIQTQSRMIFMELSISIFIG